MCASVSSLSRPQCTAGKEREAQVCKCGQVRSPVSLHFLHHPSSLCLFLLLSFLVFNLAFLSFGHILACSSVCLPVLSRLWPFPAFFQCKYTNTRRWKFKEKKGRLPRTAETYAFRNAGTYVSTTLKTKTLIFSFSPHLQIAQLQASEFTLTNATLSPSTTGHPFRVSGDHITNAETQHSLCNTKHKRPQKTENQLI